MLFRMVCTLPSNTVQLNIFITENRATCLTTTFTRAMFPLVTQVLGVPERLSFSKDYFSAFIK